MGKNPAFLFYPNDWMRDLEEHPLEIEGAWIRICCKLWWAEPRGTLTRTLEQWAKILRTDISTAQNILDYMRHWKIATVTEALPKRYQVTLGNAESNAEITVESRRMLRDEKERDLNVLRQRRFKEKRQSNAEVTPPSNGLVTEQSQRSSVPVPVSVPKTKKNPLVHFEQFDRFWSAYPRKQKKEEARKAWIKINPDESLLQTMLQAIQTQKISDQWQKDSGQYIPMPATWLNGKRWEDEISTTINQSQTYTPPTGPTIPPGEKLASPDRVKEMVANILGDPKPQKKP